MPSKYIKQPGYMGNKNLKAAGVTIEFTKEQIEEYIKCANDPVYFARKYVKVITLDKGVTDFDLYPFQEKLVRTLQNNRFVIGKVCRQAGKTTTVGCCYLLHKVLFNQNMSVAILANKLTTARDILGRIREAYEHLPQWLQQGIIEWNKGSIQLENGSKIVAAATSSSAIRGGSYNCIAGDSEITIKDCLTGEIFDISIEEFYANSSRNINNHKYSNENDRKQIQELVLFSDKQSKNKRTNYRKYGEAPYYSEISWGVESQRQYCSFDNKRAFISTSTSASIFRRHGKGENVSCLLFDDQWKTGQLCDNERNIYSRGEEKLFRSEKINEDGIETFGRNEEKNIQIKQRKNNFRRVKEKNKQSQYWSSSWEEETRRIFRKNFQKINWNKENKTALRQNKQKSRKNSENGRETPWNEKIARIKTENAGSSFEKNRTKWRSMEQGNEINRWEVLTEYGFKKFRGISKSHLQSTIKIIFNDDSHLICTPDHKIGTTEGFIEAKHLNTSHKIISRNKLISVKKIVFSTEIDVFDLIEVEDVHSFYANNILVHNCIFLDEFAFVPTTVAEEFFSSVYPTITAGQSTQMIIISTPRGLNMFYQLWKTASLPNSEYVQFEVNWREVPQYPGGPLRDDKWREQQINNTSERQFDGEFECSFIGSANTLIEASKLNELTYGKPIVRNTDGLQIYEEPITNLERPTLSHSYFITVDTARGQGKDNSAFVVVDITSMPYKVVAKFKNNLVSPLLFPSYIRAVGKKYNDAHILIEINDIGAQVADILHNDLGYENLIKSSYKGMKGQVICEVGSGNKSALGVRTTLPVKKLGCSVLKNLIENDKLIIHDIDIIDELTSFIADNQSFRADDGHNDDLVMCLVLFSWASRQDFFETLTDHDVRVEMYSDDIEKIDNETLPFGFIEDGRNIEEVDGEWDGEDRWYVKKNKTNNISSQFWMG